MTEYLSPRQAATRWNVSLRHVYELIRRREIPIRRFGRLVRIIEKADEPVEIPVVRTRAKPIATQKQIDALFSRYKTRAKAAQ